MHQNLARTHESAGASMVERKASLRALRVIGGRVAWRLARDNARRDQGLAVGLVSQARRSSRPILKTLNCPKTFSKAV